MDLSPINTFAAKLERGEIFTFIYGFALGLFIFLVLFIEFPSCKLESIRLISSDPYLLIFGFLGTGLLVTFFVHIIYNLIGLPILRLANKGIEREILNTIPQIDWGLTKQSMNDWAHLLHIYQLSVTAFIFFMIFPLFLRFKYSSVNYFSLPFIIYEIVFLILFFGGIFYLKNEWKKFSRLYALVNASKVKVFSDEKSFSENQNHFVNVNFSNYQNAIMQSTVRSFQNMVQGLSDFIR